MTEEKKILSFSQMLQDQDRKEQERATRVLQTQVYPTQVSRPLVQETQVSQTRVSDPPPPRSIGPETKGFTSLPNHLLDQILKTLDVYDQAVIVRIYRLSRGFGKDRAEVGVTKLAEATNISEKQIKRCIARLISAGLISKAETPQGSSNIYICHVLGADKGREDQQTRVHETQVQQTHNKRKELKETIKADLAPPDYKNCPDCKGSGFWYPEGTEKGVAKCKHERMSEGK
jgi:predicted transcriptional regulator